MSARDATHIPLGISCLAAGLLAIGISWNYPYGTVTAMGPGFVPTVVAGILCFFGALILLRGGSDLAAPAQAADETVIDAIPGSPHRFGPLRAMACISAAIFAFGLGVKPLGLAITTFLVVVLAGLAHPQSRPLPLTMLAIGLSAGACIGFVVLLGLEITIWPKLG